MHVPAADQPVHGGPRVHDGKYRHRSHVLLRGGHVQQGVCALQGAPLASNGGGGATPRGAQLRNKEYTPYPTTAFPCSSSSNTSSYSSTRTTPQKD